MQVRENTMIIECWSEGTIRGACEKYLEIVNKNPFFGDKIIFDRINLAGDQETIEGFVNEVWWDYDTPHGYTLKVAIKGDYGNGANWPHHEKE